MVTNNTDNHETAFTVSVDAYDTETGISAFERCQTVKMLLDPKAKPASFRRPGHMFPLRSVEGGVLRRAGHTETTADLARLAGLAPIGLCCEIMDDDGHMMRTPRLKEFAATHGLHIITVKSLIEYRKRTENFVKEVADVDFPSKYGHFRIHAYENTLNSKCNLAIVKGDVRGKKNVLVRVHSECLHAVEFCLALLLQFVHSRVEHVDALLKSAQERVFLLLDNVDDEVVLSAM